MTLLAVLLVIGAFAGGVLFGWMQRGVHDEQLLDDLSRRRRHWEQSRGRIGADR